MLSRSLVTATVAIALLTAACTSGDGATPPAPSTTTTSPSPTTSTPTTIPDDTGGFGAPAQTPGEFDQLGSPAPLRAELRLAANGCWYGHINDVARLAVVPAGFSIPSNDPTALAAPDGTIFISGQLVDGRARVLFPGELPGGPAGKWTEYAGFCRATDLGTLVFDEMREAFDPHSLDEDQIAALVAGADFTESFACGRGWAASTADQRVALYIYQQSETPLAAGDVVELPSPDWRTRVVVGEFLFANHCDDVFEDWEPSPVIAADWMIDAGVLHVLDDTPLGTDSATVRARLEGAVVATPSGRTVPLSTVDLSNRSFNFFAG